MVPERVGLITPGHPKIPQDTPGLLYICIFITFLLDFFIIIYLFFLTATDD